MSKFPGNDRKLKTVKHKSFKSSFNVKWSDNPKVAAVLAQLKTDKTPA